MQSFSLRATEIESFAIFIFEWKTPVHERVYLFRPAYDLNNAHDMEVMNSQTLNT